MDSCVARQFRDAKEVFIELLTEYGRMILGMILAMMLALNWQGRLLLLLRYRKLRVARK